MHGFSLIEMVVVLALLLYLAVSAGEMSPLQAILAMLAIISVVVSLSIVIRSAVGWLVDKPWKMSDFRVDSRRRILRSRAMRTRREERFDAMSDEALDQYIEKKPKDALALEIRCERLKRDRKWAEYAREREYLLMIAREWSIEERASAYHELATLYLEKLKNPDRAREMLTTLIENYPRHYQATLARQRLDALRQQASDSASLAANRTRN